MKVLVTGSNGFIGRYICDALTAAGHYVCGIGSSAAGRTGLAAYYSADISSQSMTEQAADELGQVDAVVHCAAHISYDDTDSRLMAVNVVGTQNIVSLAKRCGARKLVYCSGIPVIGVPAILPVAEDHPLSPTTMYHVSKLTGEYIMAASGIPNAILRIPAPVGLGMNRSSILPVLIRQCLENKPIQLYGTGSRVQNYLSVQDIARAARICAESDAEGCFHLAGDSLSNIALAQRCIALTHSSSEITFSGDPDPADHYVWEISGERAAQVLGFVPQTRIDETIMLLANSMESGRKTG